MSALAPARSSALLAPMLNVLPQDAPRAHGPGSAPYRLLAGGELFAAYGVSTHELGLAGGLARALSQRTGHGVDVELIPGSVKSFLSADSDLGRFDAVALHLDRALLRRAEQHGGRLRDALTALRGRLGPHGAVLIVADSMDLEVCRLSSDELAAMIAPVARLAVLSPATGTAPQLYATWGQTLASELAGALQYPRHWSNPIEELHESARQNAVRSLGALDEEWEETFGRIVQLARAAYGTRNAALSVIDGGTTTYTGGSSPDVHGVQRRSDTICSEVLRTYGGIILPDARLDPRFSKMPAVADGTARFYAGHRVCTPDGQPVAALCVFDAEPRDVTSDDIAPLREFAIEAEHRLLGLLAYRSPASILAPVDRASRFNAFL